MHFCLTLDLYISPIYIISGVTMYGTVYSRMDLGSPPKNFRALFLNALTHMCVGLGWEIKEG